VATSLMLIIIQEEEDNIKERGNIDMAGRM